MKSTILAKYVNGNYEVILFSDGTKVKRNNLDFFEAEFPDSLDVKITNWCDNPNCRKFCHEQSNQHGIAADLSSAEKFFEGLPAGVELAIGGGDPLSHPNFDVFVGSLSARGLIPNLTVNQFHVGKYMDRIAKLSADKKIFGVGISYMPVEGATSISTVMASVPNVVIHLIAGVHTVNDVKTVLESNPSAKILVLGYKDFGNGVHFRRGRSEGIDRIINDWRENLMSIIRSSNGLFSFDNRALIQLDMKNQVGTTVWETHYGGPEGASSMYVDLVKQEFATESTAMQRYSLQEGPTAVKAFQNVRRRFEQND